jgi:hypothetical protein
MKPARRRSLTQSSRSGRRRLFVDIPERNLRYSYNYIIFQGKWNVPLPKVRAMGEDEVMKVLATGKRRRMSSNACI